MSQWPREYRRIYLESQLKDVIGNPLADVADAQAARKAIERKLDEQDREYRTQQAKAVDRYYQKLN